MLKTKRERFQLYKSDAVILAFVKEQNDGGYFASPSDTEKALDGIWSGNFAKKINHLKRHGLLRPVALSRREYEKEKGNCTYKIGLREVVLRHRDGVVKPAYMLGENYLNGFYDLKIEDFG